MVKNLSYSTSTRVENKLIELYDIISKDIVIMDDNIKQSKEDCNYDDVLTYCASKTYAYKVMQEINKLLKVNDSNTFICTNDKLVELINYQLQFLEKKIQWLHENGDQGAAIFLEGNELAYKQMLNFIKGDDNE